MSFDISMPAAGAADPVFRRPFLIVSPPRSGTTLLFETLRNAPRLFSIGRESHRIIEGVHALSMPARSFESNRLAAEDATADVGAALRQRFFNYLRERGGGRPTPADLPLRMIEKTPKNSLRVPFFARVFPEARFVYLHRDPRQVLNSMIEAWLSGRFRTYPRLPGWVGPDWSLLLIPGWRELLGQPVEQVVAAQWEASTRILLDDLERLPRERWITASYEALGSPDWGAEVLRLCKFLDLEWDRPTSGPLPLSRYTVSEPDPDKWRKREAVIEPLAQRLAPLIERAARFARA